MLGYVLLYHSFPSKNCATFVFPSAKKFQRLWCVPSPWKCSPSQRHVIYRHKWNTFYNLFCTLSLPTTVRQCVSSTFDQMRSKQLSFYLKKTKNSILLHIRFAQQIVYSILVVLAWRHWNQIFVTVWIVSI